MTRSNIALTALFVGTLGFIMQPALHAGEHGNNCERDCDYGHGKDAPKRVYECTIDLRDGYDCSGPVEVLAYEADPSLDNLAMALASIDMHHYSEARLTIEYGSRTDWVTDFGNSETNNGACGDAATNTFDSEFDVRSDQLTVCANDTDPGRLIVDQLFTSGEPASVTFVVKDGKLSVQSSENPLDMKFESDALFQLDGFDEEAQAKNDRMFWLGLNRVIANTDRRGQGAEVAHITLIPKKHHR
jgi:hypothetical protein